jgi:hypothetical protein
VWNPGGSIDSAVETGRGVTLAGWAFDVDTPTAPTAIHAYVDGRWAGAYTADASRPDVGAAFPGIGDQHGFQIPIDVPSGRHDVCLYLINTGHGTTNPLLGCRSLTVDPAYWNPFGNLDSVVTDGSVATVSGWVIDPDVPTAGVVMHVYVDGTYRTQFTATAPRPDVAAVYPNAGADHGYTADVAVGPGQHKVCVYAINIGGGSTNPLAGCRTIG